MKTTIILICSLLLSGCYKLGFRVGEEAYKEKYDKGKTISGYGYGFHKGWESENLRRGRIPK